MLGLTGKHSFIIIHKKALKINPKNLVANINPKNAYQIKGDLSAAHDIFKKLF
jgi:hypothetical protein